MERCDEDSELSEKMGLLQPVTVKHSAYNGTSG